MNANRIVARAEQITVESDEHGFELHITTDDAGELILNIHGVAIDLYREVTGEIGPWIAEGLAARASTPPGVYDQEAREAYEPSDPKHPDFLTNADTIRNRLRGK